MFAILNIVYSKHKKFLLIFRFLCICMCVRTHIYYVYVCIYENICINNSFTSFLCVTVIIIKKKFVEVRSTMRGLNYKSENKNQYMIRRISGDKASNSVTSWLWCETRSKRQEEISVCYIKNYFRSKMCSNYIKGKRF